jgi:hypothetical protein
LRLKVRTAEAGIKGLRKLLRISFRLGRRQARALTDFSPSILLAAPPMSNLRRFVKEALQPEAIPLPATT